VQCNDLPEFLVGMSGLAHDRLLRQGPVPEVQLVGHTEHQQLLCGVERQRGDGEVLTLRLPHLTTTSLKCRNSVLGNMVLH
jgi:hypothetical protein